MMIRPDTNTLRPHPENYQVTLSTDRVLRGGNTAKRLPTLVICDTVRDLLEAAALAEVEAAAIKALSSGRQQKRMVYDPDQVLQKYLHLLRAHYTTRKIGTWETFLLCPRVELPRADPLVDLYYARYEPLALTPDQVRDMATQWIQVAAKNPPEDEDIEVPPLEETVIAYEALRELQRRQEERY